MPLYPNKIILRVENGDRRKALIVTLESGHSSSAVYVFEDPEDGFSSVGDLLAVGPVSFGSGVPVLGGTVVTDPFNSGPVAFDGNAVSEAIPPATLGRMLTFWETSSWLPGPYRFAGRETLYDPKTSEPVVSVEAA